MLKQYKKTLIVSSLVTLLPILVGLLLWDRFPEQIATHYGLTGTPDGWGSVPFAVFFPPLALLAVHWLCILFTALDKGNQNRNHKMFRIVLWILPIVSNFVSYLTYALALGMDFNITNITLVAMGLLFSVIGNYLPKTRMNSTMGIKVPWTYTSEENWNATHRFAGKVWVIGGLLMAFAGFLPDTAAITAMLLAILVLTIIPVVYSWRFWKKQVANGEAVKPFPKAETAITKGALIALIIVLIFVLCVLFAGDISYDFEEDYLHIDASFYNDYVIYYDVIENIEYRDSNVSGMRVGGYGSFQLLMGNFKNEEFGTYTRYTYYKPDACIVLTVSGKTVVLSGETKAETEAIYQELLSRTGK